MTSPLVDTLTTSLVLVALLLMCLPYEGMPAAYEEMLERGDTVITYIFILEMALKLLALGCSDYWSNKWNALDGTIVSLSIFELIALLIAENYGVHPSFNGEAPPNFAFLRVFRMMRVVRMLRLMKSWKGLHQVVIATRTAMPQMASLLLLLTLFATICSLVGADWVFHLLLTTYSLLLTTYSLLLTTDS